MFTHLFDLSYTRTTKQALGFYIVFLIILIVLGALSGLLLSDGTASGSIFAGAKTSTIVCGLLSFSILYTKKMIGKVGLILLAVLSPVLAMLGGALLGLIPIAYLTTK